MKWHRQLLVALSALGVATSALHAQVGRPSVADSAAAVDQAAKDTEQLGPRQRYNHGLESHRAGAWEEAAAAFLGSRDEAGVDTELRFRAGFNLGLAHARNAEALVEEQPQEAIDRLRQSAAWFRDAVRLRPEDDDARVNLELVLRRIQLLADQLNQGPTIWRHASTG